MKICIITPSFNQVDFIGQTISSVINQKIDKQYIVIDGNSNDSSVDIIKANAFSIDYWVSEPDHGQSHAINKGLKVANGEVVNWLNSDDYYEEEALTKVTTHFSSKLSGLGGRSRLFSSKGTLSYSRGTDIYPDNLAKTIGWARIDQPETFFSKKAWDRVGLLNESLHYCMDREWWIRYLYLFGLTGFKKINDVLVNFRIHENSKTTISQEEFLKEHHSIFYVMGVAGERFAACEMMLDQLDIDKDLTTSITHWSNKQLASNSFNYYLLKSADEFYAQGNITLAKVFLTHINIRELAPVDQKLFKKLSFRLRFPTSLIKIFRRK